MHRHQWTITLNTENRDRIAGLLFPNVNIDIMNGALITDPDLWSRFLTGEAVPTFLLAEDFPNESEFGRVDVYYKKATNAHEDVYPAVVIENYGLVKSTNKRSPCFLRVLVKRFTDYI
jgi:hypothetical protein